MSTLKSFPGDSAVELCIQGYNNLEGLIAFCKDNGLAIDHEEAAAVEERLVDDALKAELRNNRSLITKTATAKQADQRVYDSQNLVDMALQEYGSVEGLITLCRDNGKAADEDLVISETLVVMSNSVVNTALRGYYKSIGYKVATGTTLLSDEATPEDLTVDNTIITVDSDIISADQTIY